MVTVVAVSQTAGWVPLLALIALTDAPVPPLTAALEAAAGGLAGLIALGAFYRGLSVGTMSIVAPISATGAALPVVVGLVGGDRPGGLRLLGVAAAIVGVVLASRESGSGAPGRAPARQQVALALAAALGFGMFFVGVGRAAPHGVLWSLVCARTPGVLLLSVLLLARSVSPAGLSRRRLGLVVLAGLLDVSANGLYAAAATVGLLSVVAVLGSLYPVVTVLLARTLLAERVRRAQEAGVVLVLAGVGLIATG